MKPIIGIFALFFLFFIEAKPQHAGYDLIKLNQNGYLPKEKKIAYLTANYTGEFQLTEAGSLTPVFVGNIKNVKPNNLSAGYSGVIDFSEFTIPGLYVIRVADLSVSMPFAIAENVREKLAAASIKAFYYQRVSTELSGEFAGEWARPAGHPDKEVLIHASAADKLRPEGTVISSPGGWYDAGDYNKYIVNSGISMGTLFSLYEDYPEYCKKLNLHIPESTNQIPDLLDEALHNLRWMLTMQDPNDGGVYHKLTTPEFDSMDVMPNEANKERYAVQKSTAAALNFAAVCAQAYRVYKPFEKELPGLADSCLQMADKAWLWAQKNPNIIYNQKELNKKFKPAINTGEYGDSELSDEFFWAAAELYVSTLNNLPLKRLLNSLSYEIEPANWGQVRILGYYSLIRHEKNLTTLSEVQKTKLKTKITALAENLISGADTTVFGTIMGKNTKDFVWGSNAVAANQAITLLYAYSITKNDTFKTYAAANLDFILGRNATGYCFVTGFGIKSAMFPHHRPSVADGVNYPVPGMLVGGANPGQQDKCKYPSNLPEESYVDITESYASNEIAINWQAAFAYLVNALEAQRNNR